MNVSRAYRAAPELVSFLAPLEQSPKHRPALELLLGWPGWEEVPGMVARGLVGLGALLLYRPQGTAHRIARAQQLREALPRLGPLLTARRPPFRRKALRYLEEFWWTWSLSRLEDTGAVERLVETLAEPPFDTHRDAAGPFRVFLESEGAERFLEAPLPCFRHFEKLTHRESRRRLLTHGLECLSRTVPKLMVDWFLAYPHQLGRMAEQLGGLDPEIAELLVQSRLETPLFEIAPEDPVQAGRRLLRLGVRLVPQSIADYLEAGREPGEEQLPGLVESLDRSLALSQIEDLRAAVRERNRRRLELPEPDAERTAALREAQRQEREGRLLRRYLRSRLAGDPASEPDPLIGLARTGRLIPG